MLLSLYRLVSRSAKDEWYLTLLDYTRYSFDNIVHAEYLWKINKATLVIHFYCNQRKISIKKHFVQ